MALNNKTEDSKYWLWHGEAEPFLHCCWWKFKCAVTTENLPVLPQTVRRRITTKPNNYTPTCTSAHTTNLYTNAPSCIVLTTKKYTYTHTWILCYLALKRNKILTHATIYMKLENILSVRTRLRGHTLYDHIHMKYCQTGWGCGSSSRVPA
jgi:hypothetical protein